MVPWAATGRGSLKLSQHKERFYLHGAFLLATGDRLNLSPAPSDNEKVIVTGTAVGFWARDYAWRHPRAKVLDVGVQPFATHFFPPNYEYQVGDTDDARFTGIAGLHRFFARYMAGPQWSRSAICCEAYRCLEGNGWLEIHEASYCLQSKDQTHARTQLQWLMKEAAPRSEDPANYKNWMSNLGFQNVVQETFELPLNEWNEDPKQKAIGKNMQWPLRHGLEQLCGERIATLGLEDETLMLRRARKDLANPKIHAYLQVHVIIAQKPPQA